jgi:hypothetical protein
MSAPRRVLSGSGRASRNRPFRPVRDILLVPCPARASKPRGQAFPEPSAITLWARVGPREITSPHGLGACPIDMRASSLKRQHAGRGSAAEAEAATSHAAADAAETLAPRSRGPASIKRSIPPRPLPKYSQTRTWRRVPGQESKDYSKTRCPLSLSLRSILVPAEEGSTGVQTSGLWLVSRALTCPRCSEETSSLRGNLAVPSMDVWLAERSAKLRRGRARVSVPAELAPRSS